jgi:hypothetical protein
LEPIGNQKKEYKTKNETKGTSSLNKRKNQG